MKNPQILATSIQNLFTYTTWQAGVDHLVPSSIDRKDKKSHYEDFSTLKACKNVMIIIINTWHTTAIWPDS